MTKPNEVTDEFPVLFNYSEGYIRIPVWGHIPMDRKVRSVVSHPSFFRLRGIKQLSFVEYVFPGATHSRLEHSIGVFHITRQVFQSLVQNPVNLNGDFKRETLSDENIRTLMAGALLHDLGHYPHAHLLEDLNLSKEDPTGFIHHQDMAEKFLYEVVDGTSLALILEDQWQVDPVRIMAIIRGDKEKEPLGKIVSGNLDPDKMDYLVRDAHHCAVPYASVDIGRLIESFVLDSDRNRLAITNKGIASFESLVFSKYMMTRHIYWHHTVKTFGSMMKRLVQDLMDDHLMSPEKLKQIFYESNDEQLLWRLSSETSTLAENNPSLVLLDFIIKRKPYKNLLSVGFTRDGKKGEQPGLVVVPKGVMDHQSKRYGREVNTRDPIILALNRLHHDPIFRKEKEIQLAGWLNSKTGGRYQILSHEVLIDAPGFHSIFEYADLMELHLFNPKSDSFQPLYKNHLTMFQPEFISAFEPFAKELQILVHPRLAELKKQEWESVLELFL